MELKKIGHHNISTGITLQLKTLVLISLILTFNVLFSIIEYFSFSILIVTKYVRAKLQFVFQLDFIKFSSILIVVPAQIDGGAAKRVPRSDLD